MWWDKHILLSQEKERHIYRKRKGRTSEQANASLRELPPYNKGENERTYDSPERQSRASTREVQEFMVASGCKMLKVWDRWTAEYYFIFFVIRICYLNGAFSILKGKVNFNSQRKYKLINFECLNWSNYQTTERSFHLRNCSKIEEKINILLSSLSFYVV